MNKNDDENRKQLRGDLLLFPLIRSGLFRKEDLDGWGDVSGELTWNIVAIINHFYEQARFYIILHGTRCGFHTKYLFTN